MIVQDKVVNPRLRSGARENSRTQAGHNPRTLSGVMLKREAQETQPVSAMVRLMRVLQNFSVKSVLLPNYAKLQAVRANMTASLRQHMEQRG